MNNDTFKTAVLSAAIAAILGVTALAIPEARANYRTSGNGGTLCKASSGPGADVFYFDNRFAQNTSGTLQYLSCQFIDVFDVASVSAFAINIGYANPSGVAATFTCAVQSGMEGYLTTNTAVISASVPAGTPFGGFYMDAASVPAIPARPNTFVGYSMSCAVPAQGKISLIEMELPGSVLGAPAA